MTKDLLLGIFSKPLTKAEMLRLLDSGKRDADFASSLIELNFSQEQAVEFRASWTLEALQIYYPDLFEKVLLQFLGAFPAQSNQSCRRHYTNILCRVLDAGSSLPAYNFLPIVEACFEWLSDSQTPVAVQANCLSALWRLRTVEEWIEEELAEQVRYLMKNGSAAMQSRGKRILSDIQKAKQQRRHR